MKKTLLILTVLLSLTVVGTTQSKAFIKAGVSAGVDKVANENLELGYQHSRHSVSVVGQSFDLVNSTRKYLAGIKYSYAAPLLPNLDASLSLAGKTRVDNVAMYVVEPGAGLDFKLGEGLSFLAGVTSPINQVSVTSRKMSFAGNLGLKLEL